MDQNPQTPAMEAASIMDTPLEPLKRELAAREFGPSPFAGGVIYTELMKQLRESTGTSAQKEMENNDPIAEALRDQAPGYNEDEFVDFLKGLGDIIIAKHGAQRPERVPGLKRSHVPPPSQFRAVAAALYMKTTPLKGMLLADPSGCGSKTLPALMTIALATQNPDNTNGPCVVVADDQVCDDWMGDIEKFFGQNQMPSIYLDEEDDTSPEDLREYKVVVTSYSYVIAEIKQRNKFIRRMEAYKKGERRKRPRKPELTLLSNAFSERSSKLMGEVLVLDDAHIFRDHDGETFHAIHNFRDQFDFCLMITDTPGYDTWKDFYSYLSMLRGHPIRTFQQFKAGFLGSVSGHGNPERHYQTRLLQMVDAMILSRQEDRLKKERADLRHLTKSLKDDPR